MKTAMQQLILKLPNEFIEENPSVILELLKKEKEQIIISFIYNRYVSVGGHPIRRDEAEEYYNETYENTKKKGNRII